MTAKPPGIRVGVRCDAGRAIGVGHLVRCIALAEEFCSRGIDVVFLGDVGGLPWAEHQLAGRNLRLRPAPTSPADWAAMVATEALEAVILDGYHLEVDTGRVLRALRVTVLAIVDGRFGTQQAADLYLDQNLGAGRQLRWPAGAPVLAGVQYALMRDLVRSRRPVAAPTGQQVRPPEVLAVFGGTDPHRASLAVAPLVLATAVPLKLTVVAAEADVVRALERLPVGVGQQVTVLAPVDDLPALVLSSDLVLSAAGTSLWELCCLGAAAAVVCVADNQDEGYRAVVAEGLAAPIGHLAALTGDAGSRRAAVEVLTGLLAVPAARAALAARGWRRVDGRGRKRVVDAILSTMASSSPETLLEGT